MHCNFSRRSYPKGCSLPPAASRSGTLSATPELADDRVAAAEHDLVVAVVVAVDQVAFPAAGIVDGARLALDGDDAWHRRDARANASVRAHPPIRPCRC